MSLSPPDQSTELKELFLDLKFKEKSYAREIYLTTAHGWSEFTKLSDYITLQERKAEKRALLEALTEGESYVRQRLSQLTHEEE